MFFFLKILLSLIFTPLPFFSRKTLHFRSSALWSVLFPKFSFSIFSFPEALFRKTLHFRSSVLWNVLFFAESFCSQNAAFLELCTLECLISKVFMFRCLASQKLCFRKTLHFRISALWIVLFPKFSFFDF